MNIRIKHAVLIIIVLTEVVILTEIGILTQVCLITLAKSILVIEILRIYILIASTVSEVIRWIISVDILNLIFILASWSIQNSSSSDWINTLHRASVQRIIVLTNLLVFCRNRSGRELRRLKLLMWYICVSSPIELGPEIVVSIFPKILTVMGTVLGTVLGAVLGTVLGTV